jgi:hypothetical protein
MEPQYSPGRPSNWPQSDLYAGALLLPWYGRPGVGVLVREQPLGREWEKAATKCPVTPLNKTGWQSMHRRQPAQINLFPFAAREPLTELWSAGPFPTAASCWCLPTGTFLPMNPAASFSCKLAYLSMPPMQRYLISV